VTRKGEEPAGYVKMSAPKNMRMIGLLFLMVCTAVAEPEAQMSRDDALRTWNSTNATVNERWRVVTSLFTNGTPISQVVAMLGTNYVVVRPLSTVPIDLTDRSSPKRLDDAPTCSIDYKFGNNFIAISTTAGLAGNPLEGFVKGVGLGGPGAHIHVPIKSEGNSASQVPDVARKPDAPQH
jgi:hypothetical protein